jgi:methyl-accepting chemotaxis protein
MRYRLAVLAVAATMVLAASYAAAQQVGTSRERAVLKSVVQVAAQGLGAIAVKADGSADAELIRKFINPIRFLNDKSGYFFVYDYTSNYNVAHAVLKDFPGKDKTGYQDSKGLYVIQELSKLARSPEHSGYLVYHWNNPATGKEEQKLGYVEVIPGTTLYIGSGIYVRQR